MSLERALKGTLGLRKEFVLVDYGGDRHLSVWGATIDANHFALAADMNALGEGDFGGQGQSKFNGRTGFYGRIYVKAYATGTYITRLGSLLSGRSGVVVNRNRQAQGKSTSCALVLGHFGHGFPHKFVKHGV